MGLNHLWYLYPKPLAPRMLSASCWLSPQMEGKTGGVEGTVSQISSRKSNADEAFQKTKSCGAMREKNVFTLLLAGRMASGAAM